MWLLAAYQTKRRSQSYPAQIIHPDLPAQFLQNGEMPMTHHGRKVSAAAANGAKTAEREGEEFESGKRRVLSLYYVLPDTK